MRHWLSSPTLMSRHRPYVSCRVWPTPTTSKAECEVKRTLQLHSVKGIHLTPVACPGILFGGGGFQHIQFRTEDGENGDLGVVAP